MKLVGLYILLIGWPSEFCVFLDYICSLSFQGKPGYAYLCQLFHNLCLHEGLQHDDIFDWCLPMMSLNDHSHQTPDISANTSASCNKRMFINEYIFLSNYNLDRLCSHTCHQHLLASPVLWWHTVMPVSQLPLFMQHSPILAIVMKCSLFPAWYFHLFQYPMYYGPSLLHTCHLLAIY